MLYATYTKGGMGAQIWGTYDDLRTFMKLLESFGILPSFNVSAHLKTEMNLLVHFRMKYVNV